MATLAPYFSLLYGVLALRLPPFPLPHQTATRPHGERDAASRADNCLMVWRKRLLLRWFPASIWRLEYQVKKIGGHAALPFYDHPQMPVQAVFSQ